MIAALQTRLWHLELARRLVVEAGRQEHNDLRRELLYGLAGEIYDEYAQRSAISLSEFPSLPLLSRLEISIDVTRSALQVALELSREKPAISEAVHG